MADVLIETVNSNPYDSVVADTSTKISNMDEQIQMVTNEISKLEKSNPSSPTLSQLRDRLASLQREKQDLAQTNASAKSLSQSFNQWQQNVNTLKWIYDIKQQELEKAKAEDERTYRQMIEETRRDNQNYINALWNANSSENAIINANAWAVWASTQSTAEARARNYLNNAQAQAEAANNARTTINNLEQARMNSNQWYTQLSQSNADNYLRQQVLADMEAAEAEKARQVQYWWSSYGWSSRWTSSRWTSNIFDPYSLTNDKWKGKWDNDDKSSWWHFTPEELKEFTTHKLWLKKGVQPNRTNTYEYQKELLNEQKSELASQALAWKISIDDYNTQIDRLNEKNKVLEEWWKYENKANEYQSQADKNREAYINAKANGKATWASLGWYKWYTTDANKEREKANEAKLKYFNYK